MFGLLLTIPYWSVELRWRIKWFLEHIKWSCTLQIVQQITSSSGFKFFLQSSRTDKWGDWIIIFWNLGDNLFLGEAERKSCYTDVMRILRERFPDKEKRDKVEILVPGAGLGRLAWELVAEGFSVQGNEFSILMLLTSNFILNKCKQVFFIFSKLRTEKNHYVPCFVYVDN